MVEIYLEILPINLEECYHIKITFFKIYLKRSFSLSNFFSVASPKPYNKINFIPLIQQPQNTVEGNKFYFTIRKASCLMKFRVNFRTRFWGGIFPNILNSTTIWINIKAYQCCRISLNYWYMGLYCSPIITWIIGGLLLGKIINAFNFLYNERCESWCNFVYSPGFYK